MKTAMMIGMVVLTALAISLPAFAADAKPAASPAPAAEAKEGVAVTVYNGGYGVVKDTRSLDIAENGSVQFKDVPTQIDATTVHFTSLTDPTAALLEQNYQFDLVSADKLLEKHIDKPVEVIAAGKTYAGTLLAFDAGQIILKEEGGITMVQRQDNVKDVRFKVLPENLLTRPTLVWQVATKKPGKQLCEVTYQTGGVGWHAEYVMVLNGEDTAADLTGWVSVQNNSGKAYKDARMKFIAGDVRKIAPVRAISASMAPGKAAGMAGAAPMEEKAFFEYHMYTLPRPSTVADNEIKQLEMFPPVAGMKVDKKYLYNPLGGMGIGYGGRYEDRAYGITSDKKVNVFIEFRNEEKNHLGIPLPAGKVRVYKQDPADKGMEFIGEEQIDHTPKDENLSLRIGNAFDIVGERRQVDFKVETNRKWMQESIEIKVRNHKKEDVVVRVKEPMYRWTTLKITETNMPEYKKLDAFNVAWEVPVKADGEAVLTYTVEYTW